MSAARELLAAGVEDPVLVADAAVAGVRAGDRVEAPPAAAALAALVRDSTLAPLLALPPDGRAGALVAAAELVPEALAPALADAFLAEGVPPLSSRLARLCAAADGAACVRLLDAAGALGDDVWAGLAGEVVVAAADGLAAVPRAVEERLAGLDPGALAERELLTLRLRLAAREDPWAALPLAVEAIDAVGVYGVETGVEAVLGRTGPAGASAFAGRPLTVRALVRRASGWEVEDDASALPELVRELAAEHDPEAAWTAGFELAAAAARLGDAELAAAAVAAVGLPHWGAWNAVWAPLRKRGGAGARVLDAVAAALARTEPGRAADGAGPPPGWADLPAPLLRAYAELRSRADLGLPWWRPWDGGLP